MFQAPGLHCYGTLVQICSVLSVYPTKEYEALTPVGPNTEISARLLPYHPREASCPEFVHHICQVS
jgi:hypothetical protein